MGRKRVKTHTDFQLRKRGKRSFVIVDNDRISQLPDDILVDILSLLPLKEAARTSVLSSRWTNLWKHTPSLDFDTDQSLLERFYYEKELLESEKRKYVKWVNSVIKSHESRTLKEFRIRFHLDRSSRKTITRWLKFAISRQVERLDLDIEGYSSPSKYYCFRDELLTANHDSHTLLKSLKALVLKNVFVSDGAINWFLHNCPLLEQLVVHGSEELSKLEICGSSLKLKHLEIVGCARLKCSAPSLTTLIFLSNYKGLVLENVPMLVNVSVTGYGDDIAIKHLFDAVLSCCVSQLQTLCLVLYDLFDNNISEEINELPKMPKLKKLVIEYTANGHESLVRLAALIAESPYLEEFVLQFTWYELPREDRQVKDVTRIPHHHLKVFKFRGYYGGTNDAELIKYILENCDVLEKIIIDPYFLWSRCDDDKLEVEETARKNAKQKLALQVPKHVELVIL